MKRIYWRIIWGLSVIAWIAIAIPFAYSLTPSLGTINARQIVIDISQVEDSQPLKVNTSFGEVWVVKRSQQEIKQLPKDFLQPLLFESMDEKLPEGVKKEQRSIDSEYFVFSANRWNGVLWLWENPKMTYPCDELIRFSGVKAQVIDGGLECQSQLGHKINYNPNPFRYDLAGRSVSAWLSPLKIPPHFYRYDGKLVIGPRFKS